MSSPFYRVYTLKNQYRCNKPAISCNKTQYCGFVVALLVI
ncbi:hypothetical protein gpAD87_18660 [Paenibacillus sp. AD87]|nr:hypothetical protein gpAD87_18660 [Paenibacillus sp. AD87]